MALQKLSAEAMAQVFERIRQAFTMVSIAPIAPQVFPIIPLKQQSSRLYTWPASRSPGFTGPREREMVGIPVADLIETFLVETVERRARAHTGAALQLAIIRENRALQHRLAASLDSVDEILDDTALSLSDWNAKVDAMLAECQLEDNPNGGQ